MFALHLMIRNDGAIRAMLNLVHGRYVKVVVSTMFIEDIDAADFYANVFNSYDVEAIHIRRYYQGIGWKRPKEWTT